MIFKIRLHPTISRGRVSGAEFLSYPSLIGQLKKDILLDIFRDMYPFSVFSFVVKFTYSPFKHKLDSIASFFYFTFNHLHIYLRLIINVLLLFDPCRIKHIVQLGVLIKMFILSETSL